MNADSSGTNAPNPKELMKEALERKHASQHRSAEAAANEGRTHRGPHGPVGGKRAFRRKAGG